LQTRKTYGESQSAFDRFDAIGRNGKGSMSKEELKSFLASLEIGEEGKEVIDEEELNAIFDSIDSDGSGDIDFDELYKFLYEMGTFNVDVRWSYSKEDLRTFLMRRGLLEVSTLTNEEFDELFAKIDVDGSGKVDFYEFWNYFGNDKECIIGTNK